MKKFTAMAALMVVMSFTRPSLAITNGPDSKSCDDKPTVDMVDCLVAKAAAWKPRLNRAYQKLQKAIPAQQRQPLDEAQAQWVKYRDANCRFYGSGEGSIRQIVAAECLRSMLEDRTLELERAALP